MQVWAPGGSGAQRAGGSEAWRSPAPWAPLHWEVGCWALLTPRPALWRGYQAEEEEESPIRSSGAGGGWGEPCLCGSFHLVVQEGARGAPGPSNRSPQVRIKSSRCTGDLAGLLEAWVPVPGDRGSHPPRCQAHPTGRK